jgi:AcrR family transcriptional regulator
MPMPARPAGHQALFDAAAEEFAERGFDATSIRDIAARAGVSLSALYHYYPGKQALLGALLDEGMDVYFASCAAALEHAGPDPAARFAAVVAATVRYRAERSVSSLIVINEARALPPEERDRFRARQREATALFRAAIEEGVASGVFHTPYPDDARRAVISACNAVAQWYRPDGALSLDDLIRRYVTLAFTLVDYAPKE